MFQDPDGCNRRVNDISYTEIAGLKSEITSICQYNLEPDYLALLIELFCPKVMVHVDSFYEFAAIANCVT